jgi:ribosomal protein L14E/L6E/L27E
MMLVETGRVCIKKYGRDAGSRAVITKIDDENFVRIITAKRKKERRCNTKHLEFLNEKVNLGSQDEVNRALGVR